MADIIPWLAPWGGRALAAILAVIGIGLIAVAVRRRQFVLPTCRGCGYLLFGLAELRCPECGWIACRKSEAHRGKRRWWIAIAGLVIALLVPVYAAQRRIRQFGWEYYTWFGPVHWIAPHQTTSRIEIGGVVIEAERDRSPWIDDDRVIAHDRTGTRTLLPASEVVDHFARYFIADANLAAGHLTHDAEHLLVQEYSGGAHCCSTMHLFEVRQQAIREIATFETRNSVAALEDIDHDGISEMTLNDDTFAYWNACYACSPRIRIVAHWDGQRFVLARDLMRADPGSQESPITADQLRDAWQEPETFGENHVPVLVWKCLLDNIAAGTAQQGFDLIRQTWPGEKVDRNQFENDFIAQLASSSWAKQLAEFNGGELPDRVASIRLASGGG